jgi:3-oxoacyl-[acyl-carrier-protein] synthase-3
MVETSDEWITKRTGIKERRISDENEYSSDLAIKAVKNLLENNPVGIDDVDMIIVTTYTPDHIVPSVASMVQGYFNIKNAGTFDLSSGCTGFVYALIVANSLFSLNHVNKVLVISSEVASKTIDYTDRNTCVLFGDGASAVLVERDENKNGFIACNYNTDGSFGKLVYCSNLSDTINGEPLKKIRHVEQDGRNLYEYVVKTIPGEILKTLERANFGFQDIDWFVPHSANLRMIQAICNRLGWPMEKTLTSVEKYGNTSSNSIPLAIWSAIQNKLLKRGDKLLLYGFGAGLTHAGLIIEW